MKKIEKKTANPSGGPMKGPNDFNRDKLIESKVDPSEQQTQNDTEPKEN